MPTKRRVSKEIEGTYKIKLPSGTTEKTKQILEKMRSSKPVLNQHFVTNSLPLADSLKKKVPATGTSRVVIMKAAPSSLPLPSSRLAQVPSQLDSDSDENVEVIISR